MVAHLNYLTKKQLLKIAFATLCAFIFIGIAPKAQASILFEGYYKILSGSQKVGYVIQRYGYDKSKKQYRSIYFLKTNKLGGNIMESLSATCTNTFVPLKYQYTSTVGTTVKTIDAVFRNNVMTAVISDGHQKSKLKKPLPKGTFLSTFLGYIMLSKGYATGRNFSYKAIAEEHGRVFSGSASIKAKKSIDGIDAYQIVNDFKDPKSEGNGSIFVSFVTDRGEVLSTQSSLQNVATKLVAAPTYATSGLSLPQKVLKLLFGDIPRGQENILAKKVAKASTSAGVATDSLNSSSTATNTQSSKNSKKGQKAK